LPQQARDVIPKLSQIYDEPFADSSQIPTYLVSALTRDHVTVSLSGDGGDEIFAGYNRYVQANSLMRSFWSLPGYLRRSLAHLIHAIPVQHWNKIIHRLGASENARLPGEKMHKLADVLLETKEGFYPRLVTHWPASDEVAKVVNSDDHVLWSSSHEVTENFVDRMQFVDTLTYLPDDILTKVDRASMAVSLEARVPIIDHRVVEFAWTLPHHLKLRHRKSKWILRQLLYRYVPENLIDRPKTGFGIPIDQWLRGPLREWAENLLGEEMINKYGLLNSVPVRIRWQEHLSGHRNLQYPLWDILMLQAWCEEWM
jgi:asparagine synthase (glutamine-hydrolysing)